MKEFVRFLFSAVSSAVCSKLSLQMEIAALRHQLSVYQRTCHLSSLEPFSQPVMDLIRLDSLKNRINIISDECPCTIAAR
jgi:hypothetical protein